MTQYEFIKTVESVCRTLCDKNIQPHDFQYLPLYADYMRMKEEGHKVSFITYWLGEKYKCSERTVIRVINRMGRNI